jgi:LmbE family N-acetylglucosaminyl deacetylase
MRMLAVFAHPDDESFRCGGTLALLARRGAHVQLLTFSRGEAGLCGDPPLCRPDQLATVRARELRCACSALGINPPILLDYPDGALAQVDEEEALGQILPVIRELQPQVLVTWPPDGLSGHPDHAAVSGWTSLAFRRAASLGTLVPTAVYHLAVPRSIAQTLGLVHLHAVPYEDITLEVDVTAFWDQKLAAIHCHRTQTDGSPILTAPAEKQRLFLGREHFRRAHARLEQDFLLSTIDSTEVEG